MGRSDVVLATMYILLVLAGGGMSTVLAAARISSMQGLQKRRGARCARPHHGSEGCQESDPGGEHDPKHQGA